MEYTLVKESREYALWRLSNNRYTVTGIDRYTGRVTNAMPTDGPTDGNFWYGPITNAGIWYVSSGGGYSRGYAQRIYRQLTTAQAEYVNCC